MGVGLGVYGPQRIVKCKILHYPQAQMAVCTVVCCDFSVQA